MNHSKLRKIIVMSLLITLCGIVSINAQTTVGVDGAGELNSLHLDALAIQLMDTEAKMRVVARLGDGESANSLNQKRLQAARTYLIEMRGVDKSKITFTEGKSIKGEGRLEFYMDDNLTLVSLAERGKNVRIGCCFEDEDEIPPAKEIKKKSKDKTNSVETQIITLEKQAWEAWKNKDTNFFQNLLASDALSVTTDGVSDKSQIIEFYSSCEVKSYSLDDFKFRMLDKNSVLITFTAAQDAVCSGKPNPVSVRVSSVYAKRDGKWRNAFYTEVEVAQENGSIETQIIALEKQAWEEWKRGNKKFVESYLADDAVFVYSEGLINKSQVVEAVGSCKFNGYSLADFKVINLSNTSALVTYIANQDIVCDGKPAPKAVRSTSVYVKNKGKWLSTFYTETAEVK